MPLCNTELSLKSQVYSVNRRQFTDGMVVRKLQGWQGGLVGVIRKAGYYLLWLDA